MRGLPGTGAAGGLAGGLVALGSKLLPGFDLVADEVDLHDHIAAADLVLTGEGYLDEQSFEGKVVGGVQALCAEAGRPVAAANSRLRCKLWRSSAICCRWVPSPLTWRNEPLWCIEAAASSLLRHLFP